jgi:hypothetical protein
MIRKPFVIQYTDTDYKTSAILGGVRPWRFKTRAEAEEIVARKQAVARKRRLPIAYAVLEIEVLRKDGE